MRRLLMHNPFFTALVLILTLTLSFIYVPIAASQNYEEIITKLRELQVDVSEPSLPDDAFEKLNAAKGRRTALINKIEALIHQIENGNEEGAINKLKNDLRNTIMEWITDEYEGPLIEKIDEIISLIKGEVPPPPEDTTPPNIASLFGVPETPNYDEDVVVIAQVEDEESGVDFVVCSYSTNTVDWTNVTMNLEDSLYLAVIPAQSYNVNVSYKVYAYDKAGNPAVSDTFCYVVVDSYAPVISWVERSPISPDYEDIVLVTASISEPEEASGVRLVILSYFDGGVWINITMTLKEATIYEGSIPELVYGINVEYMVYASDNAENWAFSSTYSYVVGDEYPPTVRIDKPTQGSYVKGIVEVTVFAYDDNFERAELSVDRTILDSWTSTGEYTYNWNTTTYADGVYELNLTAYDKAGNTAKKAITVTLDQTLPLVNIDTPAEGSHIKNTGVIIITGADDNLEKMRLYINAALVLTLNASGTYTYVWNTSGYIDGVYGITLKAYDKAGNSAESFITVTVDNTLPIVRIDEPGEGSYLASTVDIKVFLQEDNLDKAELTINGAAVASWTSSGDHVFSWDTTTYAEGMRLIKLSAVDKAGNIAEETIKVTVDNIAPTALIYTPTEGSYLKNTVLINVTGDDPNFDRMELRIGGVLVKTWTTGGIRLFLWNTTTYSDGAYKVTLAVYDKDNNSKEVSVTVTVDNTSPVIEEAEWTPKEPYTDERVNVTVKVIEPQPGSGLQNVTLWYRNTTMDDWQPISMSLNVTSGNWTATISAQFSETTVEFYIEAFDNASNKAVTDEYEFDVIGLAVFPLAWIIAIILLLLVAIATTIYFWRKRRSEKQSLNAAE